jgi:SAM-dependent methyltransferase
LKEGPLLRCPSCGQLVSSCTAQEHEASLSKWDLPSGTHPHPRSTARYRQVTTRRLRTALGMLRTGSDRPRLLDVGCSSGALLAIAADRGFKVAGVEPASKAAEAAQRAGFEVFSGFLHEANYPSEAFDVVTMFEIIEHVGDPLDLIAECRRILKRGGVLAINTPNAGSWTAKFMKERWEGFSLTGMGGHASFFGPSSIRCLARKANLEVARIETRNVRFYEKGQCHFLVFPIAKIAAQLVAWPAHVAGRGHDLLVYLRREC